MKKRRRRCENLWENCRTRRYDTALQLPCCRGTLQADVKVGTFRFLTSIVVDPKVSIQFHVLMILIQCQYSDTCHGLPTAHVLVGQCRDQCLMLPPLLILTLCHRFAVLFNSQAIPCLMSIQNLSLRCPSVRLCVCPCVAPYFISPKWYNVYFGPRRDIQDSRPSSACLKPTPSKHSIQSLSNQCRTYSFHFISFPLSTIRNCVAHGSFCFSNRTPLPCSFAFGSKRQGPRNWANATGPSKAPETLEVEYFQPLTNRVGFPSLTLPAGVAVEEAGQTWIDETDVILYCMKYWRFDFVIFLSSKLLTRSHSRILLQEYLVSGFCQRMGTKTPYFFGPMVAASCCSAWQNMTSFSEKILKVLAHCLNSDGKWLPQGFVRLVHIGSSWRRHAVSLASCHFVLAQPGLSNKVARRSQCSIFCPNYRSLLCTGFCWIFGKPFNFNVNQNSAVHHGELHTVPRLEPLGNLRRILFQRRDWTCGIASRYGDSENHGNSRFGFVLLLLLDSFGDSSPAVTALRAFFMPVVPDSRKQRFDSFRFMIHFLNPIPHNSANSSTLEFSSQSFRESSPGSAQQSQKHFHWWWRRAAIWFLSHLMPVCPCLPRSHMIESALSTSCHEWKALGYRIPNWGQCWWQPGPWGCKESKWRGRTKFLKTLSRSPFSFHRFERIFLITIWDTKSLYKHKLKSSFTASRASLCISDSQSSRTPMPWKHPALAQKLACSSEFSREWFMDPIWFNFESWVSWDVL